MPHTALQRLALPVAAGRSPLPRWAVADLQPPAPLAGAMQHLSAAVTALQFQDMATQLIAHLSGELRNCADSVARDAMGHGAALPGAAARRASPVGQVQMSAGSVELF